MLGSSKIPLQSSISSEASSNTPNSRSQSKTEFPTPELYKRFIVSTGVYALVGSVITGTIGSIVFKSPMSRRFAFGVGFGTGLGWGLKSADDYIKYTEKKTFIPSVPKSSDEWIDKGIISFQKIKKSILKILDKDE